VRIHRALLALGVWEGRAVAFVLGCGIGVLFRMFYVMTILTYRILRGNNNEVEYTELVFTEDAEDLIVPPPHYIYADEEKVNIAGPKAIEV
jgi:hypothetical protein